MAPEDWSRKGDARQGGQTARPPRRPTLPPRTPATPRSSSRLGGDRPRPGSGVNCSGCHPGQGRTAALGGWRPELPVCKTCHADQARTLPKASTACGCATASVSRNDGPLRPLSKTPLPPMTPRGSPRADVKRSRTAHCARLQHLSSRAHDFNTARRQGRSLHRLSRRYAYQGLLRLAALRAVEARNGRRAAARQRRLVRHLSHAGDRGRAATTAPKAIFVTHNQNDNLRPNEKMVRSVCGNCHGLQFTLDALADPALVERNFKGRPRSTSRASNGRENARRSEAEARK